MLCALRNVCGINASEKKGLKFYLEAEDADIVILTETKVAKEPDFLHLKTRYKVRSSSHYAAASHRSMAVPLLGRRSPKRLWLAHFEPSQ